MRPLPVLFAVLLLTSSVAATAGVPGLAPASIQSGDVSSSVDAAQNRTLANVLTLAPGDIERTNFSQSGANASAALSLRDVRLSRQLNAQRTETRLADLESDTEKQAYIRRALTEVEIRMNELRQTEREAFRRHSTGEFSTTELVTELARVDTVSRQLAQNATRLADASEDIEGFSVQTRVDAIRLELRTLQGPVRAHAAAVIRGDSSPTRVYVHTTPEGVVLSTIQERTFVREVYDGARRLTGTNAVTGEEIEPLMSERYPSLTQRGRISAQTAREGDIWVAVVPHRRGSLTAYIDKTDPGSIFREERSLVLNQTPPSESVNETRVGLRITVHPSYPGGPMLVAVEDAQTGDPVRADVSLITAPQSNS